MSYKSLSDEDFLKRAEKQIECLNNALVDLKETQNELINSERMSTVGKMVGSIIHDFKSPMSVIQGTSQLLQMDDIDEEKKTKFLKNIEKAIYRLSKI